MRHPHSTFARLLLPLLGLMALWFAGCSEAERLNTAAEIDEPGYREGQALLKTGRRQEALASFLKVIEKRGEDAPESHLEVGLLYLQHINDPLSAIYHFRKYLALRPNSPQAPLVKQRIDAATREFARTLPAQPLENQLQRGDLVAALDRLKQENQSLKQELADVKAGRAAVAVAGLEASAVGEAASPPGLNFSVETMPTVRTRPASVTPSRTAGATTPPPIRTVPTTQTPVRTVVSTLPNTTTNARHPAAGRRHTVLPGDTLSKIAQQYYGNRAKWREIFAANRDVMKSEGDLKAGMQLKLP